MSRRRPLAALMAGLWVIKTDSGQSMLSQKKQYGRLGRQVAATGPTVPSG